MDEETTKRIVSELGEAEYAELKETYCKVQELRALIRSIHGAYVAEGTPPAIESVEALSVLMEDLYDGLERFLLPLCTDENSCGPAMCS
jgi:hypothetical protein